MSYSVSIKHGPGETCELVAHEVNGGYARQVLGLGAAGCAEVQKSQYDASTTGDLHGVTRLVEEFRDGHRLIVEGEVTPSGSLIATGSETPRVAETDFERARQFLTGETTAKIDAGLVLRAVAFGIREQDAPRPDYSTTAQ